MCGLRKQTAILIVSLTGALQAPAALGAETDLQIFASCAGRMSALMEHQWLIADPQSGRTAAEREAMLALVGAILVPGEEARAMQWRLEAKAAQADLLTRARFLSDDAAAARAARLSDALLGECRALLLS